MEKKTNNKTKVIACSRRQKENNTFADIADVLPIQENAKDLDKASILRLVINYLKLRDLLKDGSEEESEGECQGEELHGGDVALSPLDIAVAQLDSKQERENQESQESLPTITDILPNFSKDVLQALNGFLMVVSKDGKLLFTSDSIANYLGLRQVDVIGLQLQEVIHPQDYSEMSKILLSQGQDFEQVCNQKDPLRRKFVVRMRCAFTPSIRSINRCSNFKPIFCSCFVKFGKTGINKGQFIGMVTFCQLATVSKIREMVVGTFFKTKHNLDLSYTKVDTRIRWILGYDPSEMMGMKAYEYFHPQDLGVTSSCHSYLLSHGMSHSPCYRFMTRWGHWLWCRSNSRVVYNKKSKLPEGIVLHTWIVRVAEEDDRMLSIQAKENREEKIKICDSPITSAISHDASNVSTLANPLTDSTSLMLNINQIVTANDSSVPEVSLPSPPLSAELSPCQPQTCSPVMKEIIQKGVAYSPQMSGAYSSHVGVAYSPPADGAYLSPVGVAYSPPADIAYSSPVGVAYSPPADGAYSSPVGVAYSSPADVAYSSPVGVAHSSQMSVPYSSPVGVAFSPQVGVAYSVGTGSPNPHLSEYSPNPGSQCSSLDQQQILSSVGDEAFFADQTAPIQQSFSMSPPFTPYSQDQTFYDEKLTPSNCFPQSSCQFVATHASATTTEGNNPAMLNNQILSMNGHVTHFCSMSSTPSPQLEHQAPLFETKDNGNMFNNNQHPSESTADGFANYSESVIFQSSSVPPTVDQAYSHIQPLVIAETRARYSGTAPNNGGLHVTRDGSQKEVGCMRGRIQRPAGSHDSYTEAASQSISQWSQWLKSGAPEPVC